MRKTECKVWFALIAFAFAASVHAQAQSWSLTGSMHNAGVYPSATLLPDGQVLVVGSYHRGLIVGVAQRGVSIALKVFD